MIFLMALILLSSGAAGFGAESGFRANPATGVGTFAFDLEISFDLRSDRASGAATVYVNSRDGSMALANPHASLWAFGMQDIPGLQIHHVIVRAGEIMACGRHPLHGDGCLPFGGDIVPGFSAWASAEAAERFFASVASTDQSRAPGFVVGTKGLDYVHGSGAPDEDVTFWFDPGPSTVATHMPFLGPAVGVMKDYRDRRTKVVRHAYIRFAEGRAPVRWLSIRLNRLAQRSHQIDLSGYAVVTAFTAPALGEANRLGSRIMG
ncbi:MAG: hypothetical protein IBJ07_11645 [Rhizobiaceae bacterium]|nr:hypothetical protein [Rhizobiaceae bacterium]